MKTLQTVVALLTTAILCICLVSCDRKLNKKNESDTEVNKFAELEMHESDTDVSTTTETLTEIEFETETETEKETETQSSNVTVAQSTTAPAHTDASVAPTKVNPTTAHSTTSPKVTTTAPKTTATKTTTVATAVVTTTVPVPSTTTTTTTAPTTTAPAVTEQTVTTPIVIEPSTGIIVDSEDMDSEQIVISIVNRHRAAEGLGELSHSSALSAAAKTRAKELAVNYSHLRPDGTLWYTIAPGVAGENIAKGQTSATGVMNDWMNSEGHRKNILTKSYTEIGVGCYYDNATDTYYWVQLFA